MALTTFLVFTFAVMAKGFSYYNSQILTAKVAQESPPLFEQENKDQLRADLLKLGDIYKNTPSSQNEDKFELASNNSQEDINELEEYYFDSFILNFLSFEDIRSRQNEIAELKMKNNQELLPSDTFDLFLIYYLLIVEGMGLREINQIESLYELYPEDPELVNLNRYIMSQAFSVEVLNYLGVEEEDHFDQESLALSLVPTDSYHGDLSGTSYESTDWNHGQQHRAFASKEQEAVYKHLQEFKITPEEVRELVQGYQVSFPRF